MAKFCRYLTHFIIGVCAATIVFLILAGILLIYYPGIFFHAARILAGGACLAAAFASGISFLRGFVAKNR